MLNAGQKYPVEHSAVLLTCIKVPHGFKTFDCLFLSGRLRQVSMYCDETEYMRGSRNFPLNCARVGRVCILSGRAFQWPSPRI